MTLPPGPVAIAAELLARTRAWLDQPPRAAHPARLCR